MQVPILERPEQRWMCPNCNATDVTHEARPHTRFHSCAGMFGLTAPFVPEGTLCKVEAVLREDYIGDDEVVRDDDGRPVMNLTTTRDDGTDCTVFVPAIRIGANE